jgi:hypothetical protein
MTQTPSSSLLEALKSDYLLNDTLFNVVDKHLHKNEEEQGYVRLLTSELPNSGGLSMPVYWTHQFDPHTVILRKCAGDYNPYQKCMVVVVDNEMGEIVANLVERRICGNLQCPNGDNHPNQLVSCLRCKKKFYCGRRCRNQDWRDGHAKQCDRMEVIWSSQTIKTR